MVEGCLKRTDTITGKPLLNRKQYEVVDIVAKRILREMHAVTKQRFDQIGEPLRWSMHGGPGTGKSHVIKVLKEE